jgi:hypothetical protein
MRPFFFPSMPMPVDRTQRIIVAIALFAALLALGWWTYLPGLHGYFNFDDFANLNALGAEGRIHNWPSFFRYLTSGHADPTGRPITTLSFLINGNDWPASAYGFKRTNLLLHLLNGALLFWLLLKLGRLRCDEFRAAMAALVGTALWLLHPLLVSTTLYVVQREAMLPATFMLTAMLVWLAGRQRFASNPLTGGTLMFGALWIGTLLATLSKANGALLPLLVLVLEVTLLRGHRPEGGAGRRFATARGWIIGIPLAVLVLGLAASVPGAIRGALAVCPWTFGERLLTEPRMLVDYLWLLWAPRSISTGLFNDQIHASISLFHPWTTLPSIAAVLGLIGLGLYLRKRHAPWSMAILFFFAGHLLESSFIPLELYFEHRNYLPAMFMFWPLALWLTKDGAYYAGRCVLMAVLVVAVTLLAHSRAALWGDSFRQALIWARINPDSPRAQTNAAIFELTQGQLDPGIARLEASVRKFPDQVQVTTMLATAPCRHGRLPSSTQEAVLRSLRTDPRGMRLVFDWFEKSVAQAKMGSCAGFDLAFLRKSVDATAQNPKVRQFAGNRQDVQYMRALLDLASGNGQLAYQAFNSGLTQLPKPQTALKQAALLGTYGFPELGLEHLDYYASIARNPPFKLDMPAIHKWLLARQHYWAKEFSALRWALRTDATNRGKLEGNRPSPAVRPPTAR